MRYIHLITLVACVLWSLAVSAQAGRIGGKQHVLRAAGDTLYAFSLY
jgi:hypothetical protein